MAAEQVQVNQGEVCGFTWYFCDDTKIIDVGFQPRGNLGGTIFTMKIEILIR